MKYFWYLSDSFWVTHYWYTVSTGQISNKAEMYTDIRKRKIYIYLYIHIWTKTLYIIFIIYYIKLFIQNKIFTTYKLCPWLFCLSSLDFLHPLCHSLPRSLCTEVDTPELAVAKFFSLWLATLLAEELLRYFSFFRVQTLSCSCCGCLCLCQLLSPPRCGPGHPLLIWCCNWYRCFYNRYGHGRCCGRCMCSSR